MNAGVDTFGGIAEPGALWLECTFFFFWWSVGPRAGTVVVSTFPGGRALSKTLAGLQTQEWLTSSTGLYV